MKMVSFIASALVAVVIAPVRLLAAAETGPSARPDPRQYQSYEYSESGRTLRLTLPADLAVVRGILIVGPGAGGDSRDYYQ